MLGRAKPSRGPFAPATMYSYVITGAVPAYRQQLHDNSHGWSLALAAHLTALDHARSLEKGRLCAAKCCKKVSKYKAAKVPEQLVLRTVDVAPPSQEQLMVVIEGKQKEAAVTEEVVSKDPQAHFSSESHTRAFQEAYKVV